MLSTGVLAHVLAQNPAARLTVACGAPAVSLFAAIPQLERLIILHKQPFGQHWLSLWRQTTARRWSLIIDLRNSLVSRLLFRQRLCTPRRAAPDQHKVEQLAGILGVSPPPAPCLWLKAEDIAQAAVLVPNGQAVLALAPFANWTGKTWPAVRFAALAQRLTAVGGLLPGARVAVFGAPGEEAAAATLLERCESGQGINLVGRTDPRLAGACLRRCTLFIGNDSGLMHIAAAAGVPTLGLFGPSRDTLYAPWGAHTAVVRTRLSYAELLRVPGFSFKSQACWMESLPVEDVLVAVERLLRTTPGGEAIRSASSLAASGPAVFGRFDDAG